MFAKNVEKFVNHFMENAKSLTKFWELIWANMYHESLFKRLKIAYFIAGLMNNSENSWSIWF